MPRRGPLTGLAALLVTLALAGCGGSSTKTVTVSGTASQPSNPTTTASNQPLTVPTQSNPAGSPPTASPSKPPVHLSTFQAPSTNIGCVLLGGTARCDIRSRSWSPPARPASCPSVVDFGQGLEVGGSGPASVVCAGDTALDPGGPVLGYGQDSRVGPFLCQSRTSGMTCSNTDTGHGFTISVQRYSLS